MAIVGCGLYSRFIGGVVAGSSLVLVGVGGFSGLVMGGLSLGGAMVGLGWYLGLGVVVLRGCSWLGLPDVWLDWLGVA